MLTSCGAKSHGSPLQPPAPPAPSAQGRQRRASSPGRPWLRPGPAATVSRCPQVGVWETAEDSPSSLEIKCSSSFTVEPGNMGRPVTIS